MLIRSLPWTDQPQVTVPLDRANPLTRGLVVAHNFGVGVYDAAAGRQATFNGDRTKFAQAVSGGNVALASSAGAGTDYLLSSYAASMTDITVLTSFVGRSGTGQYERIVDKAYDGGWAIAHRTGVANSYGVIVRGNLTSCWVSLDDNKKHQLGFTRASGSTSYKIYANGQLSLTATAPDGAATNTASVRIGNSNFNNSTDKLVGDIIYVYIWERVLDADEIARVYSEPWQVFEPRRIWVPVSVGGGGTASIGSAAGASTASALAGASISETTAGQSAGTSTAVALTGSSVAAASISAASGASTAGDLVGVAGTGSTIGQADGASTASTLTGSSIAAASFDAGAGTSTASTLVGSDAGSAAGAIDPAAGSSAASAMAGASVAAAAIGPAAGSSSAASLSPPGTAQEGQTPAGRARRVRRRIEVEIDGEVFPVESQAEAIELLERAKREAQELAQKAVARAGKATRRPARKVIADARRALQAPTIKAPEEVKDLASDVMQSIRASYAEALQAVEIAALMAKREADIERDDEDILLLL